MNGNQPHRDLSSSPVPTTRNRYFFCSGRNTGPSGAKPETDVSPNSYWKTRMMIYFKALGGILWPIVEDVYVILNPESPTNADNDNTLADAQAMNVLFSAL